ncbi:TetR/AcrR family transcriptional regulator [Kutzneria sp. NPDC052558]|uniref:TetR/AcrR family transcriptional regulator n=1 Tax=Kutzneria sp. NPDC052558 TaxID=3364121 RepID=UPI0037C6C039
MGLREIKAARTRRQIAEVALDLFIDQGYDETTMEQIAERAEIGTTTLYRYFPSKDLTILDRFGRLMDLGSLLRARPAEEPLNVALGAAIHTLCETFEGENDVRLAAIRKIVDSSPVPRARLWDLAAQSQSALKSAIAERVHRAVDDLQVVMTAHIAFAVYEIITETWWESDDHAESRSARADEVLRAINALELTVPAPADPGPTASRRKPRRTAPRK